jgi:hypothetical protein
LISRAIQKLDYDQKLSVNLTQEKIKNSPDIETDKPVSEQQEELIRGYLLARYYGNGMYGHMGLGVWGYPLVEVRETEKRNDTKKTEKHANDKPHLRSTQEVTGYDIHATDGDIGEVEDFIIDDKLENPFSCGNRQLVFGKKSDYFSTLD